MVNLFMSRLTESNIDQTIADANEQLSRWQEDCHKKIDSIYQRKFQELEAHTKEIRTKYEETKTKVENKLSQLNDQNKANKDHPDSIKIVLDSIEQDLNNIEHLSINVNTRPLTINDSYVYIEKDFSFQNISNDLLRFNYSNQSSSALASNDQYLLMHQCPYLCLINRDFTIAKQIVWPHDWIRDICWSKTLISFIIITATGIYLVDELLQLHGCLKDPAKPIWFSCTCSNESLYVSTCEWGSSIFEFNLSPSLPLVNHWKPPFLCKSHDGINDIKYNNETIALMINDSEKHQKRMELKSIKTFDTIWLLTLSVGTNIRLFTCCPVNYNEWLVIDGTNLRIYHVTKDGKFKDNILYNSIPYRANLFSSNILAIAAENDLSLYRVF
ncbi:unnamed protein product [Rotaria socialis]|uniref:Uncharacterized protein n=2 Tax=Rotaria socialis TaxID=392032 RepID=A0A820EDW9_9BILA|nr:unnamed protein product [Rotaria socialis]